VDWHARHFELCLPRRGQHWRRGRYRRQVMKYTPAYLPGLRPLWGGEAEWRVERGSIPTPSLHGPPSTPGEGKAGRRQEEVRAGGGVDRLGCWCLALLLPPPPQVRGGGGAAWRCGARVRPFSTGGEVRTPWWLAAI
jgi:hypothetical protein